MAQVPNNPATQVAGKYLTQTEQGTTPRLNPNQRKVRTMRELNHYHKEAIALRKSQAHMYAAGWNDATRRYTMHYTLTPSKVDELAFSRYVEELAKDYYSQRTTFMPSIPHALESFRTYGTTGKY